MTVRKKRPPKTQTKEIRSRIKELRMVRAKDIHSNPKNWREHPIKQKKVLNAMLKEVGYANAVLARETENGLVLIDGHLRQEEAKPDQKIPVLILDISEKEADKVLATHDPLGAMATPNPEALGNLVRSIETQQAALSELFLGFDESSAAAAENVKGGIQISMESILPKINPPPENPDEGATEVEERLGSTDDANVDHRETKKYRYEFTVLFESKILIDQALEDTGLELSDFVLRAVESFIQQDETNPAVEKE